MTQDQPNRLDRLEASVATHNQILSLLSRSPQAINRVLP